MNESEKNELQEVLEKDTKVVDICSKAREEEPEPVNMDVESLKKHLKENLNPSGQQRMEQPKGINPNKDTKFSIFAAIANDDSFMFEIMGTERTFSNLVGLSDFISVRIQQEKDKKLQTGDAITIALFQSIQQLNAKLDTLLSNLDRPSNKL